MYAEAHNAKKLAVMLSQWQKIDVVACGEVHCATAMDISDGKSIIARSCDDSLFL